MSIDINEVDKSHFKCFKFDDGSVYYGEFAYVDSLNNLVSDLNIRTEDEIKKFKQVRHGLGVQLFYVKENSCLSKYEGQWSKDRKTGKGKCYFSDNSIYEGDLVNDVFEGKGNFYWPNNDVYIGDWVNGRMDGEGEFKHNDGHILKGVFKNNYYFDVTLTLNYRRKGL
jgi:hypothetical protein